MSQAPEQIVSPSESLPDRLSVDPASAHYNEAVLSREIGIRFNGVEKTNVEEYCVSEGWVRVAAGRAIDRKGRPLLIKLKGLVEPYFKLAA
jgi:predicted house-cleaning NTP pyrophosphatase (Maf/HAM1 superfamily)